MKKFVESLGKVLAFLRPVGRFLWKFSLFLTACGIYDVTRNRKLNKDVLRRYFLGNGQLTWLLSPFNIIMDLLALPHINKGVYELADLPQPYQEEIQRLIDTAHQEDLVGKLEALAQERARTMVFFKWYGSNVDAPIDIPAYHEPFQYIRTIGVSVFNKKQSTSRHFGPFRATLRVLYNINDMEDHSAYIEVGDVKHYWQDKKLFIFDDTLLHQSFNESDKIRYCLFVDILRPAATPGPFNAIVTAGRFLLQSVNYVFYKHWDVIKN